MHVGIRYYFTAFCVIGMTQDINLLFNTALCGFSGPQGNFFYEAIFENFAQVPGFDVNELRILDICKDEYQTPFRMTVESYP